MHYSDAATASLAPTVLDVLHCRTPAVDIVGEETRWRARPRGSAISSSGPCAIATRWHALAERTQEFDAQSADDCHVVKIVLRSMNIRLVVGGRTVRDGVAAPGMFHVTEPAVHVRCLFRGPYDVIHLHVPDGLIDECARDMPGGHAATLCSKPTLTRDPTVERLVRALLEADEIGGSFGQLYADGISTAIVARLLARSSSAASREPSKVAELVRWRLKRAIDYVEAHLAEAVSLADVASAAGLTRMHFAAQFKAATGLRPHEYLLRRRIERAQALLVGTGMSVVDVALSVGFQTQSHFTSVFNRFVGQPPRAWRRSHGEIRQRASVSIHAPGWAVDPDGVGALNAEAARRSRAALLPVGARRAGPPGTPSTKGQPVHTLV